MALPRDVGFGKDNFQKSKIFDQQDSLVNYILNILLMKPGNQPSQPLLGVDITKYIQNNMETLDTESLKGLITSNCQDLISYITNDDIYVGVVGPVRSGKSMFIIILDFDKLLFLLFVTHIGIPYLSQYSSSIFLNFSI